MSNEVQMTIKVERDLRDKFAAVAAAEHRPASQMIGEFMWSVVSNNKEPNAEMIAAMDELDSGEGMRADSVEELCQQLGIPCERYAFESPPYKKRRFTGFYLA